MTMSQNLNNPIAETDLMDSEEDARELGTDNNVYTPIFAGLTVGDGFRFGIGNER